MTPDDEIRAVAAKALGCEWNCIGVGRNPSMCAVCKHRPAVEAALREWGERQRSEGVMDFLRERSRLLSEYPDLIDAERKALIDAQRASIAAAARRWAEDKHFGENVHVIAVLRNFADTVEKGTE